MANNTNFLVNQDINMSIGEARTGEQSGPEHRHEAHTAQPGGRLQPGA